MYRPSLILPSDDYRGHLLIGIAAAVLPLEYTVFWITGVLCWIFSSLRVAAHTWAYVVLPVVLFDAAIIATACLKLWSNYSWLLQSERRARAIDIWGFLGRLTCSTIFAMYLRGMLPFSSVVTSCGLWYIITVLLNNWVQSSYVWVRLHLFEFMIALLSFKIDLKLQGIIHAPWSVVVMPLWLLGMSMLIVGWMLWRFARREPDSEIDLILKAVIIGLMVMGALYLIFLRFLTLWLDNRDVRVIHWAIPLFLSQLLSLLFAVLTAIAYSAQRHFSDTLDVSQLSDATSSTRTLCGPPIVRNMQIHLEKVGNNFYRLTSGFSSIKGSGSPSEVTPLAQNGRLATTTYESQYSTAQNTDHYLSDHVNSQYSAPPTDVMYCPSTTMTEDKTTALSVEDTVVTIDPLADDKNSTIGSDSVLTCQNDPSPVPPRTVNISENEDCCLICCQNTPDSLFLHCGHGGMCFDCAQTCFRRTGQCPTCRQTIAGVANFDPTDTQDNSITAHIRDTK